MGADGHLQFNAVSDVKGVAAVSLHCAFTTKGDRVASVMSQVSPPQPTASPQSNGSKFVN